MFSLKVEIICQNINYLSRNRKKHRSLTKNKKFLPKGRDLAIKRYKFYQETKV
jgi:hypothetical protein